MSLPKGGETNLKSEPEAKYQRTIAIGPCQPTNSDNFLENNRISRVGFEKLE